MLCDQEVKSIFRFRPQYDKLEFDEANEMVVLFNTQHLDRFERITCNGQQGFVMTPQIGRTTFDMAFLSKSASSDSIELKEISFKN